MREPSWWQVLARFHRLAWPVRFSHGRRAWNRTAGSGLIGGVERDVAGRAESGLPDARSPDQDDFAEFYQEQSLWAARLGYLLTGDPTLAEDLTQEAFLGLYRHFDRVDNPRAYLRVTLANLARRSRHREQRRSAAHRIVAQREAVGESANEMFDLVGKLPVKQRVVIVLRYYEGLSETEIATALRCPPGTVKSLASRAIDRLRKEML
jgi:RNA polymerase sigma factor (sigma-70 family)